VTWPSLSSPSWIAIAATVATAGIGGWLTDVSPWYRGLRVPSWKPPDWAFGPVWTVILGLACFAAIEGWEAASGPYRSVIIVVFAVKCLLNAGWSLCFFKLRRPDWALVEVVFLWLSTVACAAALAPVSPLASLAMMPYVAWVAVAANLNRVVVRLNAPFGPRP
jgi:tryptophan-rich sensory protein